MLFDFEHEFFDDAVHILQNALPWNVIVDLLRVFAVHTPLRVYFCDILELMVQVVVVQLKRTAGLDFLSAALVDA